MAHALSEPVKQANNGRWSDFGIRLASAAVLGPIALLALWYGGLAWTALIVVALIGLGTEWARLAGYQMFSPVALVTAVGMAGTAVLALQAGFAAGFGALLLLSLAVWRLAGRFAAAGVPYAGIGGLALLWLRLQPATGLRDTLFLVVVIWATDIGAYLAGRVIGGVKLAPRISPGKTWSGSIGGLLIGGFTGALMTRGMHGIDWWALIPAAMLSFFAQAGDLLESAVKRHLGVKDSGDTIPGHGGLFDRLDGFLAAAPVAALLALYVQGGLPLWR
ncbi:MAG: phosphatidate cytidylyltransferase [Acidocella sp.]|nr:phosphatidate cytidylyltransferase [Acidocella sp.]MDE8349006.1 phosphatidate cytidylyltransferase [Acidocella sp.]